MTRASRLGDPDEIREEVKKSYTRVVEQASGCCGGPPRHAPETARRIGYSDEDLESAPEGTNLGLGFGNPTALAELRTGDVVVDLGSGAGFDAFLAARAYVGCVGGASLREEYLETIEKAGFTRVRIRHETNLAEAFWQGDAPVDDVAAQLDVDAETTREVLSSVTSVHVEAFK